MDYHLSRKAAIVGVGSTRFDKQPGRTGTSFLAEAFAMALGDSGLRREDIDGLIVQIGSPGGQDVDRAAEILGIEARFCGQPWAHGMWTGSLVAEAAMAIHCGLADCVLVGRGASHTAPHGMAGTFGGPGDFEAMREGGGLTAEVPHFGLTSPGGGAALSMQRYFSTFGGTSRDLGEVSVALRGHAGLNPMASQRNPITIEDYLNSPLVAEPLRRLDYCQVSDGAACVIVTSASRAKDLRKRPVLVSGVQGLSLGREEFVFSLPGLGVQQQSTYLHKPRDRDLLAMRMAGVTQRDIDGFYTYDAFSPLVPFALERYGFAPTGEGLAWIQDGRIRLGGELPVNSHGGLLSEGHSSGWGAMVEMTRQLRGECGERQIKDAEALFWGPTFGNAVVLTN